MKHQRLFITLSILVMCAVSFVLRLIPKIWLGENCVVGSPDPYGHIQRIETQLHADEIMEQSAYWWANQPISDSYSHDGYLFNYVCTAICKLFNAITPEQIISVCSWIPLIIGVGLIPVFYFLGKHLTKSWKGGLLTALFSTVMGSLFMQRTLYGCIDHHCFEILFAVLFVLFIILAIEQRKEKNVHKFFLFSILAGLSYACAVLTMRTCVLFGIVLLVYIVVQTIIDFKNRKNYRDLGFLATIVFGIATIFLLINGIYDTSLSFQMHSLGIVVIQLAAIVGVWVLLVLKAVGKKLTESTATFTAIIFTVATLGLGIAYTFLPSVWETFYAAITNQLLFMPVTEGSVLTTISECMPTSFSSIIQSVNFGVILIPFGVFAFCKMIKENHALIFFGIWGIIMCYITLLHVRWECYLAVFTFFILALGVLQIAKILTNASKNEKQAKVNKIFLAFCISVMLIFSGCTIGLVSYTYTNSINEPYVNDASEWLLNNTPEYSNLEYYKVYHADNYVAPDYSVISEWSYGYNIILYGHRAVISNPTYEADPTDTSQSGRTLTADILCCQDDSYKELLDSANGKYIMIYQYVVDNPLSISLWSSYSDINVDKMLATRLWNGEDVDEIKLVYDTEYVKIYEYTGFKGNSTRTTPVVSGKEGINTLFSSTNTINYS